MNDLNDDLEIKKKFKRIKNICLWEMNSFNKAKEEKTDCSICNGKGWIAEVEVIKDKKGRSVYCYTVAKQCSCFSY